MKLFLCALMFLALGFGAGRLSILVYPDKIDWALELEPDADLRGSFAFKINSKDVLRVTGPVILGKDGYTLSIPDECRRVWNNSHVGCNVTNLKNIWVVPSRAGEPVKW